MLRRKVEILYRRNILTRLFFLIEEVRLRHETFNGHLSRPITRLCLHRGNGVGILLYEEDTDSILLTEQFRFPTYDNGEGWTLEIPAGILDGNTNPAELARQEAFEEIGYDVAVERFQHLYSFYPSPGGSSERLELYYARVTSKDRTGEGGGLVDEGEYVRLVKLNLSEARQKLQAGEIIDAKTIIGLQWLLAQ